jgi:hypothetical protein
MCYRLIHRREKDSLFSLLCMYRVSNQPEKHTTHTYTQKKKKKKKKNFFLILYIFRWG